MVSTPIPRGRGELFVWSATGIALASLVSAGITKLVVTPLGPAPSFGDIVFWQFVGWLPWIPALPLAILGVERLGLRPRRAYVAHAVTASALVALHAWWYGDAYSLLLLPVYASLLFGVIRSAASITQFTADAEGRLRTAGGEMRRRADSKLEGMRGPVLVYDPGSLRILAANDAAAEQYGLPLSELTRKSLSDLHAKMDYPIGLRDMRGQQLPIWCESQLHRHVDGRRFEVEITNHAVIFNRRWARMMLITDVTAAEAARRALADSERKFRSIFENAVIGIFRSSPEGRLLMLNPAAARMLGYASPAEAVAEARLESHYVEAGARDAYIDALRRDGEVFGWVSRLRRRDGTTLHVSENSRVERDFRGEITFIEGTVKDITAEVAAREELQAAERRAADLQLSLAHAQLRALKLQLKPHFLFNILNAAAMMIRVGDTKAAQRVVTTLGELFRKLLELEGDETVTLERELAFVDLYLGLERHRFEDRIVFSRSVPAEFLAARVPTLILQPVVENAVKHGAARMSAACRIDLSVTRRGDSLRVAVRNDVRSGPSDAVGCGVGVANTRARLAQMYGDAARFELESVPGGVAAIMEIPYEEAI